MDTDHGLVSRFFEEVSLLRAPAQERDLVTEILSFFRSVAALDRNGAGHAVPKTRVMTSEGVSAFFSSIGDLSATVQMPSPIFNIWQVTGIDRNEVRNTSILAWTLNPRGSHGKGPGILNAFLDRIRRGRLPEDEFFPFPRQVAHCLVVTEASPFADQANRVDILVDGLGFTAFVEVKVGATPSADQVERYLALSAARANATGRTRYGVIFLAPRGTRSLPDLGPRVVQATWDDVGKAIRSCVSSAPTTSFVDTILYDFANHVRNF
jgi:hypothetical protein